MKAITVHEAGRNAQLRWEEVPDPVLGPTDVLLAVNHTAVNRADLLQTRGLYPPPPRASSILGLECCGTILEFGSQAQLLNPTLQIGDQVMALLPGGGYAEKVAVDIRCTLHRPSQLTQPQAASFVETYLTAYLNLFLLGEIHAGQTALIHGGGGGVGTAAINLCKLAGVETIVTAGSDKKTAACKNLGATHAINYKTTDFASSIFQLTNQLGVPVVLDCIGASYLQQNLNCLSLDGKIVLIGLMGGAKTELNLGQLLSRRIQMIGSTLRSLPVDRKATIIRKFLGQFGQQLIEGQLKPEIFKIVELPNAAHAHHIMQQNLHFGKVVLRVPS